jgi:hypothetical protein
MNVKEEKNRKDIQTHTWADKRERQTHNIKESGNQKKGAGSI